MNSKKITVIFIIIIVVALGLYFLFLISANPKAIKEAGKITEPKPATAAPQIIQARPGELSQNFPQAIPLYGQEKIIKSYDASYPGATRQTATVFQSDKSIKAGYDYYVNWAKDNKWQIINQEDTEALKFIYLRKGGEDINITITKGLDKTKAKISISYAKF